VAWRVRSGERRQRHRCRAVQDRAPVGDAELIFVISIFAEIKKMRSAQEYNSFKKSKTYEKETDDDGRDDVAARV
jgi:hypothetical protein